MVNGIELTQSDGSILLLNFSRISYLEKTKTSGTAYFKEEEMGKPAIQIFFSDAGGRFKWITDPNQMELLWSAYREWTEGWE